MENKNYRHCHENTNIDSMTGFSYNRYVKTDNNIVIHDHDHYELFFLPYEGCQHFSNGTTIELPPQTLILIRPGDYHDFINPELKTVRILLLAVRRCIVDSFFEFLGTFFPSDQLLSSPMPPCVTLDSRETEELLLLFEQLHQIPVMDVKAKNIVMKATLMDIFTRYFYKYRFKSTSKPKEIDMPDWLSFSCSEIRKTSNLVNGLDRMVELSHVTKEHLCRSIKKHLDITASEYINDLRLTYISNMLIYSDEDIINLCYQCGFSNLSYMYSLFKKKYGVSPAEFRKEHSRTSPFHTSKNNHEKGGNK